MPHRPFLLLAALAVSGLVLGTSCSRSSSTLDDPSGKSEGAPAARATADTVVTLERTPCYGACPSYTVALLADGTVRYHGREYVAVADTATARVPPDSVQALAEAFVEARYFAFAPRYQSGEACARYVTDMPTVITSLRLDDGIHRVSHYHGCRGFARATVLKALERRVDRTAGTARWTEAP